MTAPNELSFLADDYLARKASRRANALCAGLSVIVMGGIVSVASWKQGSRLLAVAWMAAALSITAVMLLSDGRLGQLAMLAGIGLIGFGIAARPDLRVD